LNFFEKIIKDGVYFLWQTMGYKISLIICFFFLFLLVIVTVYYFFNAMRLLFSTTKKAPYIPSFNRQLELMKQLKLKKDSTMVDLGC
jgi:hypothetical protein